MHNDGDRVLNRRIVWCPECDSSVSTRPGPLKDDGVMEIRICDDDHESEHEAIFYCPPGDATYFDL